MHASSISLFRFLWVQYILVLFIEIFTGVCTVNNKESLIAILWTIRNEFAQIQDKQTDIHFCLQWYVRELKHKILVHLIRSSNEYRQKYEIHLARYNYITHHVLPLNFLKLGADPVVFKGVSYQTEVGLIIFLVTNGVLIRTATCLLLRCNIFTLKCIPKHLNDTLILRMPHHTEYQRWPSVHSTPPF